MFSKLKQKTVKMLSRIGLAASGSCLGDVQSVEEFCNSSLTVTFDDKSWNACFESRAELESFKKNTFQPLTAVKRVKNDLIVKLACSNVDEFKIK